MLKHRLIFGSLMVLFFLGLNIFDGWLDGSLGSGGIIGVSGSLFFLLVVMLAFPAQLEMTRLAERAGGRVFTGVCIFFSILLAGGWYFGQFFEGNSVIFSHYFEIVCGLSVLCVFFWQGIFYGTKGTISNCGASLFSIFYLGLLSSFVVGIRVDYGLWVLLMFILTVKSSDIGAYTVGRLFGRHKFSPGISPGKTWEGMAGGVVFSVLTGSIFAVSCGIMEVWQGGLFGLIFAFVGQLGDLAESMVKRDAQQKDSASNVPGFGGVLDVIDSPVAAAPLAYIYFMLTI